MELTDIYTDKQIDDAVDAYIEAQGYSDWVDSGIVDFSTWPLDDQIIFMQEWS